MSKKIFIIVIIVIIIAAGFLFIRPNKSQAPTTEPSKTSNDTGTPNVSNNGNELEKKDLIIITSPRPYDTISSPVTIEGEARGNWFFEATFPVLVADWDGKIIGQGVANAQGDWQTQDFVPYKAVINFNAPGDAFGNKNGTLILKKDNPSGLPEYEDSLEIPVIFK